MSIAESLLPEFDNEMANTRRTLERVPDDKYDWKPHEKSSSMGDLASHLANLPYWAVVTIGQDELDIAPPGGGGFAPPRAASTAAALEQFDENVAAARAAIAGASDETLFQPWTLLKGGQTVLSLPRAACLRTFVLSHVIHHRAQLGVYLRINDIPVPSIYGPSADEGAF